jgi:hypothetical protein
LLRSPAEARSERARGKVARKELREEAIRIA